MRDSIKDALEFRLQLYQNRARNKGREFELTFAEFEALLFSPCAYCGGLPEHGAVQNKKKIPYRSNGIDRKDNSKGYTVENCLPCCIRCNSAKCDDDMGLWLEWVHRIAERTKDWDCVREMTPEQSHQYKIDRMSSFHQARYVKRIKDSAKWKFIPQI